MTATHEKIENHLAAWQKMLRNIVHAALTLLLVDRVCVVLFGKKSMCVNLHGFNFSDEIISQKRCNARYGIIDVIPK